MPNNVLDVKLVNQDIQDSDTFINGLFSYVSNTSIEFVNFLNLI